MYLLVLFCSQELLDRTGYTLDVTTGQRKYGGPPPGWGDQPQPGAGHEVKNTMMSIILTISRLSFN